MRHHHEEGDPYTRAEQHACANDVQPPKQYEPVHADALSHIPLRRKDLTLAHAMVATAGVGFARSDRIRWRLRPVFALGALGA
jgi:hypothetical protein